MLVKSLPKTATWRLTPVGLMVGLKSPRGSLVLIHLVLSMELRQLVEQLPTGVLRSSITPGQVGQGLYLVYPL